MNIFFWKNKNNRKAREPESVGLRRQSQISRNLEVPIEEEPESLDEAVRKGDSDSTEAPHKTPSCD